MLTAGDSLLPVVGEYGIGASAVVFPNQKSGLTFIDDHRADLQGEELRFGDLDLLKVQKPLKLMRRAAGEGLAGIQVVRVNNASEHFMFMVRVEEAGEDFPTILTVMTQDGWGHSLTPDGELDIPHGHLLHWKRYDILDRLNGLWGQRCPFRDWNHGDPLYELRTDNLVVLVANVDILGDWNSPDGSFAFFTSETYARYYCEHHLGDGTNRTMVVGPVDDSDPHESMASLRPEPVNDLLSRLVELSEVWKLAAWCINPVSHREDSGYGRLFEGMPGSMLTSSTGLVPRMIAVSGHWLVHPRKYIQDGEAFSTLDEV